ncbi:MAG TPA: CBS domain-containing protein [Nitrososphaerales archaeon]|nr:CBS domain-containing protein [Nitrososphaerales archaeon]
MSQLKIDLETQVAEYVQPAILVSADDSIEKTAKAMSSAKAECAVVTSANRDPIGIVTEWDILSRAVAQGKDVKTTHVREIMSSPLWTITPSTKVGEAMSLMLQKGFRRIVVKEGSRLMGIATLTQVIGSRREASIPIPLFEPARGSRCPYCGSVLKDRDELSSHIDEVHIREDILKGIRGKSIE